ncbi:MAG: DUF434 domain-containing protein [Thermodesulfobacteriota bacterium]
MKSKSVSPSINEAAEDFRFLLSKGYPRKACLTLVGNRYGLDRTARQILHRGVFAAHEAEARRAKLRRLADLADKPLGIDGHNVLITLESSLKGLPLVAADDGFIRDVAQLSRAFRSSRRSEEALTLLAQYLRQHRPGSLSLFYDAPMSKSGELARRSLEIFQAHGLDVEAAAVPVPERELLAFPGPIATSDTHLIDAKAEIVDLAGEIIRLKGMQLILVSLD